jgi:outer membrane autotransporter protein
VIVTGNGQAINGASSFQGIQVNGANAPTVNISNLSVTNTAAIGGNGQNGQNGYYSGGLSYGSGGGGGGGLGAGGGLLVGSGANVTLASVTFTGNAALGGTGGSGGSAQNTAADPVNGGNGGAGGAANNGGSSGGGGAGGTGGHVGGQGTTGTAGASLGAGGGGGGGSGTTSSTSYTANNSGGSGNANGGNGGAGGDGVTNNNGSQGPGTDGGFGGSGGSANGGAIYVATGGTLTILDTPITGAAVAGGAGGSAGVGAGPSAFNGTAGATGTARGAGIYLSGVMANIGVSSGTVTYANTIGGTGLTSGGVTTAINKTGAGTLALTATNDFTGNVNISAGTLSIATTSNLGNVANDVVISGGATLAVTGTTTLANGRAFKIEGASTIDVAASTTTLLQGVIADGASSGSLVKSGDGTLQLSATNTYSGATTVNAGTLRTGSATAIPSGTALTIGASGTFDMNGFSGVFGALTGAGSVTNGGSATASITVGGNNSDSTYSGTIQNGVGTLSLTKVGSGQLTLSGANSYTGPTTISSGTLMLNGSLSSSVTVNSGAAISIGAGSTGTINGNYTQAAGATFRTHVADNSTYGKLVVTGTATLPSNALINVDVASPNFAFTATKLTNIITAGTLVSDGTFSVTDNSNLFDFHAKMNGNAVDLCLSPAGGACGSVSTAVLRDVNATNNTPARGAAVVFDNLLATFASSGTSGNSGMDAVITGLGKLTTEREVSNFVSQTLPLLTGGSTSAVRSTMNSVNNIVQARLNLASGRASGDSFLGDKNLWMKPLASRADQNDRDGVAGYKAETYGLVVGFDDSLSPALRIGGAFTYAGSDINGKSAVAPQSNDVSIYQLIGYGSYAIDGRSEINFQADVGQNTNKGRRQIAFTSSVASSNYDSNMAHLGLGFSRTYPLSSSTTLTPSLRADYIWIKDKSYSETGAGPLNLNVSSRATEAFIVGVDGKLEHQLNDQTILIANLGVGYDTINKQDSINAAFAGASSAAFVTYGIDPSPWLGRAGVGAVYKLKNGLEITGRYDVEYRESFLNQTASANMRWAF